MTKRQIGVIVALTGVFFAVMVIMNPSEDRHLDKFVRKLQAWESAHAETCESCDTVSNDDDLRLLLTSKPGGGGMLLGEGLRRKNYHLFSVLTIDGMSDARTFGMLGCVFGPTLVTPFPCRNQDLQLALPEPRQGPEPEVTIQVTLRADGSIVHQEQAVSEAELTSRLEAMADKATTAVHIEVAEQAEFSRVNEIMRLIARLGYARVQMSVTDDAAP